MLFSAVTIAAFLASGVNAHFRLLYPETRGPFVANREPDFCGGYTDATTNRTVFPLEGGFFRVRQGHENWTASVLISTVPNPSSFEDFAPSGEDQFVRYWANEQKGGNFCIPLNISDAGIPGAVDGANVTIQVAFAGPDGDLYQCADLTLSSNVTLSDDIQASCVNQTNAEDSHGSGSSGSGSHGSPSPSSTAGADDDESGSQKVALLSGVGLGLAGLLFALGSAL